MKKINTVTGQIKPEELGVVHPHEHIFTLLSEDDLVLKNELLDLKKSGVNTIVEVSTPDLVPREKIEENMSFLKKMSKETGIKIILGVGFYKNPKLPGFIKHSSVEQLTNIILEDIEKGIGDVKPGIIGEVGSSNYQIFPEEEKVLKAAGRAQKISGLPLSTHTGRASMVKEQLDLFSKEKVEFSKVAIGHLDVFPRLEELIETYKEVLDRGAFLQFDTIGKEGFFELELDYHYGQKFPYDYQRAEMIVKLAEQGYSEQILISCDIDKPELLKTGGGRGYSHLLDNFIPLLKIKGAKDEVCNKILIENPKRFFSG